MKVNYLSIWALFVLGLIALTSCEKQDVDQTMLEEEEVPTEVVVCNLEVLIAEQPPGSGDLFTVATGGATPYTFSWSTGETTANISGATQAGTYTVTVTDDEGCVAENEIIVAEPDPCESLTAQIEGSAAGILIANIAGGTSPYAYSWSTGETTSSITVTAAGTYTLMVTDAQGCTIEQDITITGVDLCLSLVTEIAENPNGNLTANTTGGSTPYTYVWSTGEATSSISVAAGGMFSVTVTDANGCTVVDDILAAGSDPCLSFTALITEQPPGSGALFTSATGGTFPFVYLWSTGATTSSITVTTGGTYSVTITDSAGCIAEDDIQL